MKNANQVLDSAGRPIVVGAIVCVKRTGDSFNGLQGLVMSPHHSNDPLDKYTVAVFFGQEIEDYRFNHLFEVRNWDRNNADKFGSKSDFSFLLNDELWTRCPRVIYFKPTELVVQDEWNIEILAERLFKNRYRSLLNFPEQVRGKSSLYMCFSDGCDKPATRIALFNVWGSVYPLHVCDKCYQEHNGWCGDDLPRMKDVFLLADGNPATA